jgi:hypothetical protein
VGLDEPVGFDADDGFVVGFGDLGGRVGTLYFSVMRVLAMRTLVHSDSLGAYCMLRAVIMCSYCTSLAS